MKLCWIDLETTSLSAKRGKIIEIGAVCASEFEIYSEFQTRIRHDDYGPDFEDAYRTHKISKELLQVTGKSSGEAKRLFYTWIKKHFFWEIANGGIMLAGQNIQKFDEWFLRQWMGQENFRKAFHYRSLDISPVIQFCRDCDILKTPDSKLKTVAFHLGIEYQAHCALADANAARTVYQRLKDYVQN